MIDLDDPIWITLRHAGGDASHYPNVLRRVKQLAQTSVAPDDELLEDLWDICHQFSTYDATLAAIPHLIELCHHTTPDNPIRKTLLDLIACSVACVRSDGTTATPEIEMAFRLSLDRLPTIVIETLPYAQNRTEMCRLLGAYSVSASDDALGMLLFELPDGSLQCEQCQAFNSPFESSLNPLWDA